MARGRRSNESDHNARAHPVAKPEKTRDEPMNLVLCNRRGDGHLEELAVGIEDVRQTIAKAPEVLAKATKTALEVSTKAGKSSATQYHRPSVSTKPRTQPLDADQFRPTSRITEISGSFKPDRGSPNTPDHHDMKSFMISEEPKVVAFLEEKLVSLQQQFGKRLAKAWIKGICPKKQARFPYQNSMREKENLDPEVPAWWPVKVCQFKEPDHICKDARMSLCLHLLRLRPTVQQLREWNSHGDSTELCKRYQAEGWTAFLKAMTPNTIFHGLDTDRPERRKHREKTLEDIYHVAAKEEEYLKGNYDPESVIHWEYEPKPVRSSRVTTSKHYRQSSIASSSDARSTESLSSSERECKRPRRDAATQHASPSSTLALQMSNTMIGNTMPMHYRRAALPHHREIPVGPGLDYMGENTAAVRAGHTWRCALPTYETHYTHHDPADPATPSYAGSCSSHAPSLTTSFTSTYREPTDVYGTTPVHEHPMTFFPGKHEYAFPGMTNANGPVSVYHAQGIPQPDFDTVPNTPAFSPILTGRHGSFQAPEDAYSHNQQQPLDVTFVAGHQRYHINEDGLIEVQPQHRMNSRQHSSVGFAVSEQPSMPLHTDNYHQGMMEHRDASINGLPTMYTEVQRPPPTDRPLYYPDAMPDSNLPAYTLPGSVERGDTGHSAGVGGGAWT